MNRKKTVILRADGNREIGMGHFTRSIALAEMLNSKFHCHFAVAGPGAYHKNEIKRVGAELIELPGSEEHFESFLKIPSPSDIVVLDNYFFDTPYQQKIKNLGCSLVCIDDMHDRHYLADLVINHSPSAEREMYSCAPDTKLLLGMDYVLLRNEFLLQARMKGKIPQSRSVMICFGGSDTNNLSLKYARLIHKIYPEMPVTIVLGAAASGEEEIRNWIASEQLENRISCFGNLTAGELIRAFERSWSCIVPSSGIMFEVIASKRILITGYFVDNQKYNANKIRNEEKGIFVLGDLNIPDENSIRRIIDHSMKIDYNLVTGYNSTLIDGLSGKRILNEFERL